MLGQHPDMYGFPELNLFISDTIKGVMKEHLVRPNGADGLLRAIAQLHSGAQTEENIAQALEWIEEHEAWTVRECFDHLRNAVAPRIAVDKSPRIAMRLEYLDRLYEAYPKASFLHLLRHPRSMCMSTRDFLKENEHLLGSFDSESINPENMWIRANENIMDFCATLPLGQCMQIKGESLLSEPRVYLPQIAEWLDVRTDKDAVEAMLHPEMSPYACIGPASARYGNDPDFLQNPAFREGGVKEPELEGKLEWAPDQEFSRKTLKLAREFGYR
jgi:hypothetical protein